MKWKHALVAIVLALIVGALWLWTDAGRASVKAPSLNATQGAARTSLPAGNALVEGPREIDLRHGARVEENSGSPDSSRATRIEVVDDPSGTPIANASVAMCSLDGKQDLGRTDSSGLSVVLPSAPAERWLLVESAGYATKQVHLAEPHPKRVRVAMQPAALVTGSVVTREGLLVGKGVRVVAYPATHGLSSSNQLRALDAGLRSGAATITDENGRFLLQDLAVGLPHVLQAGGKGYLTPGMNRVEVTPGVDGDDVRLIVDALLGVVVRPRNALGEAPDVSLRGTIFGVAVGVNSQEALPLQWSIEGRALLAGVDREALGLESVDDVYLASPKKSGEIEANVYVRIPGYEVAKDRITLRSVAGGITEHVVELVEVPNSSGDVLVRFAGVGDAASGAARARAKLVFWLDDTPHYEVNVTSFEESLRLTLPVGTYRVDLVCNKFNAEAPLGRVDGVVVDVQGAQEIEFDLSSASSLWLRVHLADGREYDGRLLISFGRPGQVGAGIGVGLLTFYAAPYRIEGLVAGKYQVNPYWPYEPEAPRHLRQVQVRSGEESMLELVVR